MRKAYSILAVAITTTACSAAVETTTEQSKQQLAEELSRTSLADALARKDHFMPLCDANGYPLPGNINPKGGGTTVMEFCEAALATAKPVPTQPPPVKPECPAQLNADLGNITLDAAIEQRTTYRPICDAEGYPLCGNLNGKVITTASEFCQALRYKNLL
jgi:hypothetical protein